MSPACAREPVSDGLLAYRMHTQQLGAVSVLHVVAPGWAGGLESVVQSLAIGSCGSPVTARVAAVIPAGAGGHPFLRPLREAGVEVFAVTPPPRGYRWERAAVAALCRRLQPDVVHTHGYRADVVDAAAARRLGIAVVTTVHGFTGGGWKNRFYEWLQRRAFRSFDAVVAVSRPLAQQLVEAGVPPDRLHFIQNAWRPAAPPLDRGAARQLLGLRDHDRGVGWVGRLSREKGLDLLVEAFAHLADMDCHASIVGEGLARKELEARAATLGLSERLRWHGTVANAGRLFAAFDVFVLSSRTEGMPVVLFEAMASGVPIVATAVGGVPDVVSRAEALLVPPEDPGALADAIAEVFRHPEQAAARAAAARRRLERDFAVEPWLRRYEALYRGLLRADAKGARA